MKRMVKKISDNYHLPYFTISPTFSICPIHGYLAGEHEYCPKCDADIAEAEKELKSSALEGGLEPSVVEDVREPEALEVIGNRQQVIGDVSIVVSDDAIRVVKPKVGSGVLVPVKSKLDIGGNEAVGFGVTGDGQQVAGILRGSSAPGNVESKLNIGGDTDGEN